MVISLNKRIKKIVTLYARTLASTTNRLTHTIDSHLVYINVKVVADIHEDVSFAMIP